MLTSNTQEWFQGIQKLLPNKPAPHSCATLGSARLLFDSWLGW